MNDTQVFIIGAATLGQAGFCFSLLLSRAVRTPAYLPLAVLFLAIGVLAAAPVMYALAPQFITLYATTLLPASLLLGPLLWLYVVGLTSSTPWKVEPRHAWHMLPFSIGVIVTGLMLSLPHTELETIFLGNDDIDQGLPLYVVIATFVLILTWIVQSAVYVFLIFHRLSAYRRQLKDLFASNEHRELGWLSWLLSSVGGVWLVSMASLVTSTFWETALFSHRVGAYLALVLVWSLGLWGLRQKPGFEGRYLNEQTSEGDNEPDSPLNQVAPEDITADQIAQFSNVTPNNKYQRSALGKEQSLRIADKINNAMAYDALHLDPDLSVYKLAHHIDVSTNYISQTLNQTMGANFFDYVNTWRIKTALPQIITGEKTVLDVALTNGFNARSSFYKAFKRETGKTPSEYRKTLN